jgi:hypothetical protein
MADTHKRHFGAIAAIVAGTVIADLIAIAAAVAAGTSKFPEPLRIIQEYPWQSILILSAAGLLCAIWQSQREHSRQAVNGSQKDERASEEIDIDRSRLISSAVSVVRGTRARIRRSRLKNSPLTIKERAASPHAEPEKSELPRNVQDL